MTGTRGSKSAISSHSTIQLTLTFRERHHVRTALPPYLFWLLAALHHQPAGGLGEVPDVRVLNKAPCSCPSTGQRVPKAV